MFPRDKGCLRNISVETLHKGDTEDDDNNNNNSSSNNNNNNNNNFKIEPAEWLLGGTLQVI